jgi:hypothetical protein
MVNPFKAVSQTDHGKLNDKLTVALQERDDARREAAALRVDRDNELQNGERLTSLAARAIQSTEIYRLALIERQIGAQRDPSMVLVVSNLPEFGKKRYGFIPLNKRRREAAKRVQAEETRRNALPKLTADLPPVPLTQDDLNAMREVMVDVKENS